MRCGCEASASALCTHTHSANVYVFHWHTAFTLLMPCVCKHKHVFKVYYLYASALCCCCASSTHMPHVARVHRLCANVCVVRGAWVKSLSKFSDRNLCIRVKATATGGDDGADATPPNSIWLHVYVSVLCTRRIHHIKQPHVIACRKLIGNENKHDTYILGVCAIPCKIIS